MPELIPFIGRKNEIDKIKKLIQKDQERQIICIHGDGGIGKTRLLQEIRNRQAKKRIMQVTEIIDFDDQSLLNPENMSRKIANMLDPNVFEPFFLAQVDYHKMRAAGVSSERLNQERLVVKQKFEDCFNAVSNEKSTLLFLDTTDCLEEAGGVWKDLEEKIPQLKHVVILMAGRNARNVGESLQKKIGSSVEIIDLTPLPVKDSKDYLQQIQEQKHITIELDLAEKLIFLSGGRPILLDLAVEWRTRGISLNWLVEGSLEEIKRQRKKRQQEFEQQLVRHIQDMRYPMDQLILLMSYIYPLNVEMISELLKGENVKGLFEEATSYVFVKPLPNGYISLHDEMRRLVNEYVWPEVDLDGGRRRWYSELAVKYLANEIKNLTQKIEGVKEVEKDEKSSEKTLELSLNIEGLEQHLWDLREQQMDHTLSTNLDEGVKIFETLFAEATKTSRFSLRKKLFDKLEPYVKEFSSDQKCVRDIQQARLFFDDGKYKQAQKLCEEILEREDISPEHQVDTLLLLGNLRIRLVVFKKSISNFQRALKISEKNKLFFRRIKAYNALGWAYRLTGDIDRAQEYYHKARLLCLQEGGPDREELADDYGWITNNLAFLLSENNKTRRTAIDIAHSAIEHWQSIGNDIGLGVGYSVLGIVYYRNDLSESGLEAFQKALNILEPLKLYDWLGQIYSWRGALYQDRVDLAKAQRDLEESLKIGAPNIEAMTLNRLGRVYMSREEWDLAEEYIKKSLRRAQRIPDYKYWLSSVARLAAIAAAKGEYQRLDEFEQMLKDCLNKIEYPEKNALGVAYLGLAKLALGQDDPKKVDAIIDFLKQGIPLVTEFGSYARADILSRLDLIERDFHKINPEIIHSVGKALQEYFSEKEVKNIAYSTVTPRMYKWANWKKERNIDE